MEERSSTTPAVSPMSDPVELRIPFKRCYCLQRRNSDGPAWLNMHTQKFKDLEQDRMNKHQQGPNSGSIEGLSHAQQLAARDKVRQLSLETNRRRRAQELKHRLEAQKEAKRRQDVLEERRRRQQEATQKYQRGQKGVARVGHRASSGKTYSDSKLQEGLNIAMGSRQHSKYSGNHGNRAPALEEVLRMVRVSTAPGSTTSYRGDGYGGGADYTTLYRRGHSVPGVTGTYDPDQEAPFRRPFLDTNGNAISENKGQHYHGYTTSATATYSSSNVNQDATGALFHETLHEQQRQLMQQQHAALNEFNQAVLNEALPSQGEELQRSASLSSVDSLEEEQQKLPRNSSYNRPGPQLEYQHVYDANGQPKNERRENLAIHEGSTYNYVPTKIVPENNDSRPKEVNQNGPSAILNNRLFMSQSARNQEHPPVSAAQSRGLNNGELLVEETSESDFIRDPVDTKPRLLQGSKELQPYPPNYAFYPASQVWTPQGSSESPNSQDAFSQSTVKYPTGPISVQTSHRPLSARTTATSVSSYPARIPEPPSDFSHFSREAKSEETAKRIPTNEVVRGAPMQSKYDNNNHEDNRSTKSKYSSHQSVQHRVIESTQTGFQKDSHKLETASHMPERFVKSILKRSQGQGYSPQNVKLGGVKVTDSLELSRANQGTRGDRKSVRWTDLKYSEIVETASEDSRNENQSSQLAASKTYQSKTSSTRIGNDSVNDKPRSERQIVTAGTPPKGPTKLARRSYYAAAKPPPGRPNPSSASKLTESENTKMVSHDKPLNQQQTTIKYSIVDGQNSRMLPNGIRLDKTPTDDEINWLWDKVRTCLNTQDQMAANQASSTSSKQSATMSKQFIDGNRLTANLRVSSQNHMSPSSSSQDYPLANQRKYNTYPRFRTNSDSGTASLRKRRQYSAVGNVRAGYQGKSSQHNAGSVSGYQPSPPSTGTHHQLAPTVGNQGPLRGTSIIPATHNQEVSESLLAFQHAEQLATQDNLSESEIAAAIEHHKNHAFTQKVPTALSMEEQRILESLDKLNAQLRTVTTDVNAATQPYMLMQPKPPPPSQGSGFRSGRSFSARQKAVSQANGNHRTRTLSADRSNARINHYH